MQPGSNPLGTRPDQAGRKSKQWLAGSLKRLKEKRAPSITSPFDDEPWTGEHDRGGRLPVAEDFKK
jgi:hypothetical protein